MKSLERLIRRRLTGRAIRRGRFRDALDLLARPLLADLPDTVRLGHRVFEALVPRVRAALDRDDLPAARDGLALAREAVAMREAGAALMARLAPAGGREASIGPLPGVAPEGEGEDLRSSGAPRSFPAGDAPGAQRNAGPRAIRAESREAPGVRLEEVVPLHPEPRDDTGVARSGTCPASDALRAVGDALDRGDVIAARNALRTLEGLGGDGPRGAAAPLRGVPGRGVPGRGSSASAIAVEKSTAVGDDRREGIDARVAEALAAGDEAAAARHADAALAAGDLAPWLPALRRALAARVDGGTTSLREVRRLLDEKRVADARVALVPLLADPRTRPVALALWGSVSDREVAAAPGLDRTETRAPSDSPERGARPGRSSVPAVAAAPADPVAVRDPRPSDAPSGPPLPGPGATRFMLRVEEGPEALVLTDATVRIGNARDPGNHLAMLAHLASDHARIRREVSFHGGIAYVLRAGPDGECRINGASVREATLQDGDQLQFESDVALRFVRPDPGSATALIQIVRGHPLDDVRNVLLMKVPGRDGRIRIGGSRGAHLQPRKADRTVWLYAGEAAGEGSTSLVVEADGPVEVDGVTHDRRAAVAIGSWVCCGPCRFHIGRVR